MKLFDDVKQEERSSGRSASPGSGSTSKIPHDPDFYPGWEDSAVAPEDVGNYLRDLQKLFDKYGYTASLYGHFGQGCVHCSIDFDLYTADGIERWKQFLNEAAHLVTSYGGSLSGEHGDGQARGSLLPIMFGDEIMQAFREFKAAWDPRGKMNPGKVDRRVSGRREPALGHALPPVGAGDALLVSPTIAAASRTPRTAASARASAGSTTAARCARATWSTREEKHSTRGRARLLFEMLEGNPLARRLARRVGEGGARPLSRLQGLPRRVSGERRHGDVQGGVPVALLRRPAPAASRRTRSA